MDIETLQRLKLFAQIRPSGTSAVSAIAKSLKRKIVITSIIVCNTGAGSVNFSLYLDPDGTTYDKTTALAWTIALTSGAHQLIQFENGIPFDTGAAGNFAVQTSAANDLTFTIIGIELV